jgi:hypothetical protein
MPDDDLDAEGWFRPILGGLSVLFLVSLGATLSVCASVLNLAGPKRDNSFIHHGHSEKL